ncbi:TPA: restriction endonuclease subunit S [Vibrio vulnificus]
MSSNWPLHSLSDFINVKHGFAFKGEFFKDERTADLLVTPGNFAIGGGFKSDKFKFYEGPVPEDYVLSEGDLIVTMTDLSKQADTLGYSALVPKVADCRLLHNQRVGLVEFKNDELDKTYLYFLLRSKEYRHHVVSTATGSTVKHSSPTKILSFEFRKPPKDIQIDIGKKLIALEEKIELNTQINQTLEQIAQAIFKSWFVDFDPVKAKIEALAAGGNADDAELAAMGVISAKTLDELNSLKASNPEQFNKLAQTATLFPATMQDSELGEIPEGWGVLSVQESFKVVMGQSPKGDTYNDVEEGTLFYQGRAEFGWRFPTPRLYTTDPKRMASKGDVLMSVRAPVGDLNIAMNDCCVGRGLCSLLHNSGSTSFTYYLLKSLQSKLDSFNGEGTVFGSINQKDLKAIRYVSASDELISSFIKLFKNNDEKIETLSLEILSLSSLRDTLLPKLLSGEIDLTSEVTA